MMRLGVMIFAACVLAAGCGDDNPTSPSNLPLVFTAQLRPANEVPPVANAESVGSGAVQITVHPTRDSAGAITAGTVDFSWQVSGFPDSTSPVASHIHNAVAGVNGPIVVDTGLTAAMGITTSGGIATFSVTNITANPTVLNNIVADPGSYYFNVHSRLNPAGFVRGQLVRIQ
jgi:hypothetical protein